jgi:dihydroxyacetone kinase-like predicted kinase
MNPSVKDLVVAINKVVAPVVYLFANDKNIVLAAKEAAALSQRNVVVVATRTIAEGIAALFALINRPDDAGVGGDEILAEASGVLCGSIFRAGRDASIGGVSVKRNQLIGALDAHDGAPERLVEGKDEAALAIALVRAADAHDATLVTVYYGGARKLKEAESLSESLRAAYPNTTVETYYGGQPSSDYVISIERS